MWSISSDQILTNSWEDHATLEQLWLLEFAAVVQSLSCVWLFATPWTAAHQAYLSLRVCSNSGLLSRWCQPTISPSIVPFSSSPQSFPASGSFSVNWLLTSGGQSIGASAVVLPMNIQGWFPLGSTGLISLLSKGLSRVFNSTTIWNHQFFSPNQWTAREFCSFLFG